jgi:hypothetical protein
MERLLTTYGRPDVVKLLEWAHDNDITPTQPSAMPLAVAVLKKMGGPDDQRDPVAT